MESFAHQISSLKCPSFSILKVRYSVPRLSYVAPMWPKAHTVDLAPFTESAKYTQALFTLVSSSYLKPATVLSHQSTTDTRLKYFSEEKAKIVGYPTAKQLREAKEVADARLKREEEDAEKIGLVSSLYSAY